MTINTQNNQNDFGIFNDEARKMSEMHEVG